MYTNVTNALSIFMGNYNTFMQVNVTFCIYSSMNVKSIRDLLLSVYVYLYRNSVAWISHIPKFPLLTHSFLLVLKGNKGSQA